MPVCSFCRKRFKEPRGLTVFTFDGKSIFYCSGKCRKNIEHLHRDPKKVNWVIKREGYLQDYRGGEMTEVITEKKLSENTEAAEPVEKKEKAAKK